jgi:hypothetical protein
LTGLIAEACEITVGQARAAEEAARFGRTAVLAAVICASDRDEANASARKHAAIAELICCRIIAS